MALKVDAGTEPGVDLGPVISKQVHSGFNISFFYRLYSETMHLNKQTLFALMRLH